MPDRRAAALVTDPRAQRAFAALLVFGVLLACWLAFTPRPVHAGEHGDKWQHFAAFSVLAICAALASGLERARTALLALALLGFGVFIEVVQSRLPARQADPMDVLADLVGIAAGLLLAQGLRWLVVSGGGVRS